MTDHGAVAGDGQDDVAAFRDGAGTFVAQAQTAGSVAIPNVTATDVGAAGTYNCGGLQVTGSGNSGWDSRWEGCGWP